MKNCLIMAKKDQFSIDFDKIGQNIKFTRNENYSFNKSFNRKKK